MYSIWIERYSPAGILQQDIPGYIFLGSLQMKKSKIKIVTSSNIKELNFSLFLSVNWNCKKITHWEQKRSNGNFRYFRGYIEIHTNYALIALAFSIYNMVFLHFEISEYKCNEKNIVENLMATRNPYHIFP